MEQFIEHVNNQSPIEIEAEQVDQTLSQELQGVQPDQNFYIKFSDIKRLISTLKKKNSTGLDGNKGILPDEQTGFRAGHNMFTRIVSISDQIGQGLITNTAAAVLFVDFKSAFNQMWFKGLWVKLQQLNCPKYIIAWLRNYLTGRSAYIEIKGHRSNCFSLHKGVPQGSCVGPVLFTVFHYDILTAMSNLHFKHLYADDLAIVFLPSATWSSKQLMPYLSHQITQVIKDLYNYSIT
ncbi:unnamed protein product [Rotaria sp. Silwood2]|nr:unnamed protein product [Rotaria sp. Silwood2]CAF4356086.1 unnamed protein product [Rotaria sp. Silwood2]